MADDKVVEVAFDLKLRDIDMAAMKTGGLDKGVKQFTTTFQKTLDKASKTMLARSFRALKGKDATSDLVAGIQQSQKHIENLKKEYLELSAMSQSADRKMRAEKNKGAEKVAEYTKKLQELEKEEQNLASNRKKAQQMYAANMGAAARTNDPNKRSIALFKASEYKKDMEYYARQMTPEAQASRDITKKFYRDEIANKGIDKQRMAELQKQKAYAREGMASNIDAADYASKKAVKSQQEINKLNKLGKVGSAFSKFGAVIGNIFSKKQNKNIKRFGKSGYKATGLFSNGFKKLGKNVMMFGLGFRSAYYLIKSMRNLVIKDLAIMASKFDEVNKPLSDLLTAFNQLKGSIGTIAQPIISAILPALQQLVQYLNSAAEKVASFFAVMTGQDYIYKAKANQKDFASSILGNEKLADYDQLKVIGDSQDVDYEKVAVDASKTSVAGQALMDALKGLGNTVKEIFGMIGPVIAQIQPIITEFATLLLPMISDLLKAIIPPLLELLPPIVSALSTIILTLMPVIVTAIQGIMPLLVQLVNMVLPLIVALIQAVAPIIQKLVEILLPILQRILTALQPIFDVLINTVLPFIVKILDALMPLIEGILNFAISLLEPILSLIAPLLEIVVQILEPVLEILAPILKLVGSLFSMLGQILKPILQLLTPLLEIVSVALTPMIELLRTLINIILVPLCDIIEFVSGIITALVSKTLTVLLSTINIIAGAAKVLGNVFKTVFQKIRDAVDTAWGGMKKIFNAIIGGVEWMVNCLIKGINQMIDALNKLSFDIPDWVPMLGGSKFGLNISKVSEISIPKLAQGAVIPPNKEFIATLGDQRYGTNVEAPLDTIKQALIEALSQYSGAKEPVILQLNGKEVAKAVWSEEEKRYKQTGKLAYSY